MAPMSKPTIKKHNCQEEGHIACGTYNPSPTTMKECKCECHVLGEYLPCSNPNCQPSEEKKDTGWEERFDSEFPYDTLVSAHQDWTYDAVKKFISRELQSQKKELLNIVKKERDMYFKKGTDIDYVIKVRNKLRNEIVEDIEKLKI